MKIEIKVGDSSTIYASCAWILEDGGKYLTQVFNPRVSIHISSPTLRYAQAVKIDGQIFYVQSVEIIPVFIGGKGFRYGLTTFKKQLTNPGWVQIYNNEEK